MSNRLLRSSKQPLLYFEIKPRNNQNKPKSILPNTVTEGSPKSDFTSTPNKARLLTDSIDQLFEELYSEIREETILGQKSRSCEDLNKDSKTEVSIEELVKFSKTKIMELTLPEQINIIRMLELIPIFRGNSENNVQANLEIFLQTSETIHNSLDQKGRQYFLTLVACKLRDEAHTAYRGKETKSFVDLKTTLNEIYKPRVSRQSLNQILANVTQLPNETIPQYNTRIASVLTEYDEILKKTYKDELNTALIVLKDVKNQLLPTYIKGIQNQLIRNSLFNAQLKTFDEAAKLAVNLEKSEIIETTISSFKDSDTNLLLSAILSKLENAQTKTVEPSIEEMLSKLSVSEPTKSIKQISTNSIYRPQNKFCRYCKRKGHTIEECRTRAQTNQQRNFSKYQPTYSQYQPPYVPRQSQHSTARYPDDYYSNVPQHLHSPQMVPPRHYPPQPPTRSPPQPSTNYQHPKIYQPTYNSKPRQTKNARIIEIEADLNSRGTSCCTQVESQNQNE